MSEFRFFKIKVKLNSVNVRQELHGEEHRLAMDIGLEFNQSNRALDKLDGRLIETFYWKSPTGPAQDDLDGVERVTDFPNLRFEHLVAPIKWAEKFEEGLFRVHHGDDSANDIVMRDAKINEIKFYPKEGGTVTFNARIQCHPDEADVARICTALQSEITATIDTDPDEDESTAQPEKVEKPARAGRLKKGSKNGQADAFDEERVQQIKDAMNAVGNDVQA
ncbi:hypothetical protein WK09_19940 [Burkholderia ubonensis]|uniref:hypothetical protein n=1 Tax=Burkholderia ubonensis TaxID=101571 RepID=UPI00075B4F11|nr:hypothetical protein [Burkholderia ubonensis]KVQ87312.1 hypothetical protein WK09_19940 [Burkholderia ubonensis]KWB89898.1 hypothetical protein WL43_07305 [Burkholderia ubonensis]